MNKSKRKFWEWVGKELEQLYHKGHPSQWDKPTRRWYLEDEFLPKLRAACQADPNKAHHCKVTPESAGQLSLHQTTFWRIFQAGYSNGRDSTMNMFAIFLGYNSRFQLEIAYQLGQGKLQVERLPAKRPNWEANLTSKFAGIDTQGFFFYDDAWVGRNQVLKNCSDRLDRDGRVLLLNGISGVGKTALAEKIVLENQHLIHQNWSYFYKKSFSDDPLEDKTFVKFGLQFLEKTKEETVTKQMDAEYILERLISILVEKSYIILIDSLEHTLKGNVRTGWTEFNDPFWLRFISRIVVIPSFGSKVIITTQDVPRRLEFYQIEYPHQFYSYQVKGLSETHQQSLFTELGLRLQEDNVAKQCMIRIGKAYQGHPLALKVITKEIIHSWDADVTLYWKTYGKEIIKIEEAIREANSVAGRKMNDDDFRLDSYQRVLRTSIQIKFDDSFNRLKHQFLDAYLLLCHSSIYRCAVEKEFWFEHLRPYQKMEEEIILAFDVLLDRRLIDSGRLNLVQQHNLVRSVALRHNRNIPLNGLNKT